MFSPQQIGTRPNTREHAVLEKLWEARPHTSLLETQTDTSSIWTELAAATQLADVHTCDGPPAPASFLHLQTCTWVARGREYLILLHLLVITSDGERPNAHP